MTTTCEHGRERATCPECGALATAAAEMGGAPKFLKTAVEAAADFEKSKAAVEATVDEWGPSTPEREAMKQAVREQAEVDEAVDAEFGKTRPLTDVEEKWVRLKHPDMSKKDLDALIAQGLPADVTPITRADLPEEVTDPHAFTRAEWDARRKKRKIAKANRSRNRRARPAKAKHAKKRSR